LGEVLEAAFDYRGDVTLTLDSGEELAGYIFNRIDDGDDSLVEIFPQDSADRVQLFYRDIRAICFSGRDTASGKSWETWMAKYNSQKAARERGEDVDTIQIEPESLD
jgi:hypothetical protein